MWLGRIRIFRFNFGLPTDKRKIKAPSPRVPLRPDKPYFYTRNRAPPGPAAVFARRRANEYLGILQYRQLRCGQSASPRGRRRFEFPSVAQSGLMADNITPALARLQGAIETGLLPATALDPKILADLGTLPEHMATVVVERFLASNILSIRNPSAFLVGTESIGLQRSSLWCLGWCDKPLQGGARGRSCACRERSACFA